MVLVVDRGGSAAADGVGDRLDRSGSGEAGELLIRKERKVRAHVASASAV